MAIHLYNTLTQRKEPFEPLEAGRARIYACGVTVYDLSHIGHARSALVFEVIRRHLQFRGYGVTFVRNFTDLDDKIIARARERGIPWEAVARQYIDEYTGDMGRLGLPPADVEPKATEHIPEMIAIIRALLDRGLAYQVDGDVFFEVRRFPDYGRLSHRNLEDLRSGARVEVDPRKRDPVDFALWKASKAGEPWWESPWGRGRPGWHIECSAMSMRYLGESFDIHGGGADLIFPHHENEIAQSEGATGKPFARYWIHNALVNIDAQKMSKSLGNYFTVRDLLDREGLPPEAIKLFLLSTHYRSPIDFSIQGIKEKAVALDRFSVLLRAIGELGSRAGAGGRSGASPGPSAESPLREPLEQAKAEFTEAMDDDFNTPKAIGALFGALPPTNTFLRKVETTPTPEGVGALAEGVEALCELAAVLAIDLSNGERGRGAFDAGPSIDRLVALVGKYPQYRPGGAPTHQQPADGLELIGVLVSVVRANARRAKDFRAADEIRDALAEMGVTVQDKPTGPTWFFGRR